MKRMFFSAGRTHKFEVKDLGKYALTGNLEKFIRLEGKPISMTDPDAQKWYRNDRQKAGHIIPSRQTYTAIVEQVTNAPKTKRSVFIDKDENGNMKGVMMVTPKFTFYTDGTDLFIHSPSNKEYKLKTNELSEGEDNIDLIFLISAYMFAEDRTNEGRYYSAFITDSQIMANGGEDMIRYLIILSENLHNAIEHPMDAQFQNTVKVPYWTNTSRFLSHSDISAEEIERIKTTGELIFGDQPEIPATAAGIAGKYRPKGQKEWSDEEKNLIFKVPSYYSVPAKLEWAANLYCKTYGKRHEFKDFILPGRSGKGKSVWAKMFSAAVGLPLYIVNCNEEMTVDDLLAKILPADGSKGEVGMKYLDSPFLTAFEHGGVILLEEIRMLRPAVLAGLNGAMDSSQSITTLDGRTIHRHPDCVVIMTTNTDYAGCKDLNQSVFSRCTPVMLPEPSEDELVERLKKETEWDADEELHSMVEVYQSCVNLAEQNEITDGAIDFRALADWAAAASIDGEYWKDGVECLISKCSQDEKILPQFMHCLEMRFSSDNNDEEPY